MDKKVKVQLICYSIIAILWFIAAFISLFLIRQIISGCAQATIGVLTLILVFVGYRVNRKE